MSLPATCNSLKTINDLPHEVLLNIVAKIEYVPATFQALSLTSQKLHSLLTMHKAALIKEIASEQFALEATIYPSASPSCKWLSHLLTRRETVHRLIRACSKDSEPCARAIDVLVKAVFNKIAAIGLHVIQNRMRRLDRWQEHFLDSLPTALILRIWFAMIVVATGVKEKSGMDQSMVVEHAEEISKVTELLLQLCGYHFFLHLVANPEVEARMKESERGKLAKSRQELKGTFAEGLAHIVNLRQRFQMQLNSNFRRRVERIITLNDGAELDMAVIEALGRETLGEKALIDMLQSVAPALEESTSGTATPRV